jgi:uncharacterized YigZ family protein
VHRVEDVVQRSRFVTTLARASTSAAAREFVAEVERELPDATHHCWAFVAGPPGSTAHVGMSDAGEPKGTAGRPMLTALLHSGVGEVVAVASRWFGGTKLGTGGLARAYAAGVTHALTELPTERRVERVDVRVTVAYAHVDAVRRLAAELAATVVEEVYGEEVRYRLAVPSDRVDALAARLADATAGAGRAERAGRRCAAEPNNLPCASGSFVWPWSSRWWGGRWPSSFARPRAPARCSASPSRSPSSPASSRSSPGASSAARPAAPWASATSP